MAVGGLGSRTRQMWTGSLCSRHLVNILSHITTVKHKPSRCILVSRSACICMSVCNYPLGCSCCGAFVCTSRPFCVSSAKDKRWDQIGPDSLHQRWWKIWVLLQSNAAVGRFDTFTTHQTKQGLQKAWHVREGAEELQGNRVSNGSTFSIPTDLTPVPANPRGRKSKWYKYRPPISD